MVGQRREEGFPPGAADLQFVGSHLHHPLLHALHLCQIDKVAAVAAGKGPLGQLFLKGFQGACRHEIALFSIKMDAVSLAFQIIDEGRIQPPHPALHRQGQIMPCAAAQLFFGLAQLLRKRKIRHRLEHIVQRAHGVPADGVLGHIRDEDDDHVQKQDVVHRAVIIQQLHAVSELRHRELGAVLPGVPLHIALKLRPHLCLVLDQSNAYHCRTSFFRNFSSFYCNTK